MTTITREQLHRLYQFYASHFDAYRDCTETAWTVSHQRESIVESAAYVLGLNAYKTKSAARAIHRATRNGKDIWITCNFARLLGLQHIMMPDGEWSYKFPRTRHPA